MSNVVTEVWYQGITIGYAMYQGSADVQHPAVYPTRDALDRVWRTSGTWRECKCGEEQETLAVGLKFEGEDEDPLYEFDMCDKCKTLLHLGDDE